MKICFNHSSSTILTAIFLLRQLLSVSCLLLAWYATLPFCVFQLPPVSFSSHYPIFLLLLRCTFPSHLSSVPPLKCWQLLFARPSDTVSLLMLFYSILFFYNIFVSFLFVCMCDYLFDFKLWNWRYLVCDCALKIYSNAVRCPLYLLDSRYSVKIYLISTAL